MQRGSGASRRGAAETDRARFVNFPSDHANERVLPVLSGSAAPPKIDTASVTVNVALGVRVWFRFLSTTFIFNVYCPGSKFCSGSSFSTVTCAPKLRASCVTFLGELENFLVGAVFRDLVLNRPFGFWVFSSGSKL